MRAIIETSFDVVYLISVITIGIIMIRRLIRIPSMKNLLHKNS